MEWIKSILGIAFIVGVITFLPLVSTAEVVATDNGVTVSEENVQTVTYTYDQLIQSKAQSEKELAGMPRRKEYLEAHIEKVNLLIAQIEAERAKKEAEKPVITSNPILADLQKTFGAK